MAGIKDLGSIWDNVKEIDLRPARESAEQQVTIAIVGRRDGNGNALAAQMRRDPSRPEQVSRAPVLILDHKATPQAVDVDLVIVLAALSMAEEGVAQLTARRWMDAGHNVLVFLETTPLEDSRLPAGGSEHHEIVLASLGAPWQGLPVVVGSVRDEGFLLEEFVPLVIKLLPDQLLSLGRHFPLFRVPIARHLINDTCFTNAAYALSTGLAEIVPIFDIPLNVADMVVLTKAQAFLVYKIGLALGLSTRWQDYAAEFGGVIGGGFLWRQLARQLVGLIPAWGIVPKVAVSYAGTFVVGNVVLHWYLTGKHVSKQQMRQLYRQAFARGKRIAQEMARKLPRPRLRLRRRKRGDGTPNLPAAEATQVCARCGKTNAPDANFCQYCGQALVEGSDTERSPR